MEAEILEIDGSQHEGGGQILRISLALSAIVGVPIKITKIRAGRSSPGLKEQHLKCVELAASLCKAKISGCTIGSQEIKFCPGKIECGQFFSNIKTAGSISLLLQVALPICLYAKGRIKLTLRGGTNVPMAPQVDYLTEVFRPNLELLGATFDFDLIKRGYFPRGGGEVIIDVEPVPKLSGFDFSRRGDIVEIYGYSFVAGRLPIRMAEDMTRGVKSMFKNIRNNLPHCEVETYKENADVAADNCSGLILVAKSENNIVLGSSELGRREVEPFKVGENVTKKLINTIHEGSSLDEYGQDQLIIFMALAHGTSKIKVKSITKHTETAIYIVELITKVRFSIRNVDDMIFIECKGLGHCST